MAKPKRAVDLGARPPSSLRRTAGSIEAGEKALQAIGIAVLMTMRDGEELSAGSLAAKLGHIANGRISECRGLVEDAQGALDLVRSPPSTMPWLG